MRSVLFVVFAVLFGPTLVFSQTGPIAYRSFEGENLRRYVWLGDRVAILTVQNNLDRRTMRRMVTTLDAAYSYYAVTTGGEPARSERYMYNVRLIIASVPKTCGAGCAHLGSSGIEIQQRYFDDLYHGVRSRGEFSQIPFYELGRNFWQFAPQLQYPENSDAIVTGFAVFMRFASMRAAGARGAPFHGRPFSEFERTVRGLIVTYERNPRYTWTNTLRVNQGVPNAMNLGATDLFASMMFRLSDTYGGDMFLRRFFDEVRKRPVARTHQDAVDNFVIAASRASGRNLSLFFEHTWKFPVSEQAKRELSNVR